MALIACPDCGASVSDQALSCPKCSRPIKAAPAASKPLGAGTGCLVIIVGFIVVMAVATSDCQRAGSKSTAASRAPAIRETGRDYCAGWRKGDATVKRYAVLSNIKQLDDGKVDKACLAAETDEIVRWVNRRCATGSVDEGVFALELVRKAKGRCP